MADHIAALLVLLVPPLVQILIMVAARIALESGDSSRPSAELDHLLDLKRLGTLLRAPAKIADESARSKPLAKTRPTNDTREENCDDGLEHLVQLKREREDHARSRASAPFPRN